MLFNNKPNNFNNRKSGIDLNLDPRVDLSLIETQTSLINSMPGQLLRAKASIIYLPGFGCDFENHNSFKDLLTSYDYYAINFPAHGNSIYKNASELTLTHFTNIVCEFIKQRDLKNVFIIGHGSSAAVAANVSKILPNIVNGIIYVSPIESQFQKDATQVSDVLIPRIKENLEQLNRLKVFNYDLKSNNSNAWAAENERKLKYFIKNYDGLEIMLSYLLSDQLKQSIEAVYQTVTVPQLVVVGSNDGLIRINDFIKKAPSLFKNAALRVVPIAGHEPAFDNPNNYFSNVVNFIDDVVFNIENKDKK